MIEWDRGAKAEHLGREERREDVKVFARPKSKLFRFRFFVDFSLPFVPKSDACGFSSYRVRERELLNAMNAKKRKASARALALSLLVFRKERARIFFFFLVRRLRVCICIILYALRRDEV